MTTSNAVVPVCEPLSSEGRAPHTGASHSFPSDEARETARLSAMAADAQASVDGKLSLLWRDLARGEYTVVDDFFSEERCYLLLTKMPDATSQPVASRRLEILEAVLSGLLQKNVAIDLDLAPSTIALNSRLALETLGVARKPSRVHPLLMLAAKAASAGEPTLASCATFIDREGRELLVVSAPRPDLQLARLLPCAELAVIRRLVEGLSYIEIARARGTSTRTIANQITAVFRRLRVSGRNELVQRLFADENLGRQAHRTGEVPIRKEGFASSRESGIRPRNAPWAGARRSA